MTLKILPSSRFLLLIGFPLWLPFHSAPPTFSAYDQRRSRRFLEFPELPRARKNRQEPGYGAVKSREVRKEAREGGTR